MKQNFSIPKQSYGVLQRDSFNTELEEVAEQVLRVGYAVLDSGKSPRQRNELSNEFERTRAEYIQRWGKERLRDLNELHTIRSPLSHGDKAFLQLAMNSNLISVIELLIAGKFILNQQNGIINPPNETYNQAAWHRDLPYQHFVSSSPLAINALYCVDDFTKENGATFVLPASHKVNTFPSPNYIKRNAVQVEAKAGQFILLDAMLFHAGGYNSTNRERRAINHVYTIPFFKQQIAFPEIIKKDGLDPEQLELLGFDYREPTSIEQYLLAREK